MEMFWINEQSIIMGPLLCRLPAGQHSTLNFIINKILLICSHIHINKDLMRTEVLPCHVITVH